MTLHHDLLDQASHLATRETKKPKQASLRRAVSAAYYALFHLLVADGAKRAAAVGDRLDRLERDDPVLAHDSDRKSVV